MGGERELEAYRLLIADVYELAGQSRRTSEVLAGRIGQTAARWHLLSVVSDGPRTVAGAARRLGLTRQSVQRVADDLVDTGHAQLLPNPDHARAPLLTITSQGQATLAELIARSSDNRRALLDQAGVSTEDLAAARAVLSRLLSALRTQTA